MRGPPPTSIENTEYTDCQGQSQADHKFKTFPISFQEMPFPSASTQTSQGQALPVPGPHHWDSHTPYPISQGSSEGRRAEEVCLPEGPEDPLPPSPRDQAGTPTACHQSNTIQTGEVQGPCPMVTKCYRRINTTAKTGRRPGKPGPLPGPGKRFWRVCSRKVGQVSLGP